MQLIYNLRTTNTTQGKQILLTGIPHPEWKVFVYAYHPESMYRVKFAFVDQEDLGEPSEALFTLLDKILSGELRGNDAKAKVTSFAKNHGNLIKLICNKDLKCGVTATTFNKSHPGSIPQFSVQLAKEVSIAKLKYPVLAQIKFDGVRLIAKQREGKVTLQTRNGKFVNLPDLIETIEKLPFKNYILDGEIVLSHGLQADRTSVSGRINSAMHGGIVDENDMVFHIFDSMTLAEFEECNCPHPYSYRYQMVGAILNEDESERLQIAQTNTMDSAKEALNLYEGALLMGYEGLVLKYPEHLYTFKRSKDWIKIKEVKTADLRVVGIQDGTGKYEGMIGALICEGEVEGKKVYVNVGSGLSDIDRTAPSNFMYKVIEVKYNAVIQDSKTSQWSLFLPRYTHVREDR